MLEKRLKQIRSRAKHKEIETETIEKMVEQAIKRLQILQANPPKSKAEIIYETHEKEFKQKYLGKMIAIDVGTEKVAGVGDTIEQAYEDAVSKTDQNQFYFKRVGQNDSL